MNHPSVRSSSFVAINLSRRSVVAIAVALSTGCTTVSMGDKGKEDALRRLEPVPDRVSLYICREPGFAGAGLEATVMVNETEIATLGQNTFAHTVLAPGRHEIFIVREGFVIGSRNSGVLSIETKSGEVPIVWVGMTGGGFGVLTVDNFNSRTEAGRCVRGANYAVKRGS